ncbi:unnamed protein product [Miscanthus lutarioriparius]|uniref:DUF4220 domain-containing protein n=1 Tax=Miscanthus lutarioriparius TaxID=422564 RepID=A0A811R0D9_9POAL|nr:unnamed protein product [Miscanthus lutarioriparius]
MTLYIASVFDLNATVVELKVTRLKKPIAIFSSLHVFASILQKNEVKFDGVVKYVERTWALMRNNLDSIRGSLEEHVGEQHHFHPPYYESMVAAIEDDEFYLHHAHSMFQVCKRAIVDSWMASMDEKKEDDHQSSYWDREEKPRPIDDQ